MNGERPVELIYGVDDFPPWSRSLLYGIQWAVIFLPTLMILSAISSEYLGLQGGEKVLFSQKILIISRGNDRRGFQDSRKKINCLNPS